MSFLLPIQLFKILADETRLGIVLLLSELGELCVCDLCTALDQSQPKISRHLALLRESGLLLVPQEGVTHNAQGKATALILDKDDVVQLREIEASKAIGDQWVVTSGLQAGDRVIVSGLQRIRPGIKARAISSSQENASTESKQ